MTDATTAQLLAEAQTAIERPRTRIAESERAYEHAIWNLINVARRQDARIAALEAARAPHGPPLEGTGPLPLERKGG